MKVYVGYDAREDDAYRAAAHSLVHVGITDFAPLVQDTLRSRGLYTRPQERKADGVLWDLISGAPMSTDFSLTRFLVPIIKHEGWALFVDCDVIFLRSPMEMLNEVSYPRKAVYVVKHSYTPSTRAKMDGKPQTSYPRKNWSSVMLINCGHKAWRDFSLRQVNGMTGRWLHGFEWLADEDIGELSAGWNWLVDEQPRPDKLGVAHFTLGVPSMRPCGEPWIAQKWWETLGKEPV